MVTVHPKHQQDLSVVNSLVLLVFLFWSGCSIFVKQLLSLPFLLAWRKYSRKMPNAYGRCCSMTNKQPHVDEFTLDSREVAVVHLIQDHCREPLEYIVISTLCSLQCSNGSTYITITTNLAMFKLFLFQPPFWRPLFRHFLDFHRLGMMISITCEHFFNGGSTIVHPK